MVDPIHFSALAKAMITLWIFEPNIPNAKMSEFICVLDVMSVRSLVGGSVRRANVKNREKLPIFWMPVITMGRLREILKMRFEKLSHLWGWSHGMWEICLGLQNELQPSLTSLWLHQNTVWANSIRTVISQVALNISGLYVSISFQIEVFFLLIFSYLTFLSNSHWKYNEGIRNMWSITSLNLFLIAAQRQ